MAKNKSTGLVLIIIIVIGAYIMLQLPTTSETLTVWTNSNIAECNSERQDTINSFPARCVGGCTAVTQQVVNCFAAEGRSGEIGQNDLGMYGYFDSGSNMACNSLTTNLQKDYTCLYNTPTLDTCTDSDNGLNYDVAGTVTTTASGLTFTDPDVCIDSNNVQEFYCNGLDVGTQSHTCTNGCSNGKCNVVSGQPNVQLLSEGIQTQGSRIIGGFELRNVGGIMTTSNILEMQVVPAGMSPQSVIGSQQTCNPSYPNNIYVSYQLTDGLPSMITLQTPTLNAGSYDVYASTVTKCYDAAPVGNSQVQPYGYNTFIDTVQVTGNEFCVNNQELCSGNIRQRCTNNIWVNVETCPVQCVASSPTSTYCSATTYTYYCVSQGIACTSLSSTNPTPPANCYTTLSQCESNLNTCNLPGDAQSCNSICDNEYNTIVGLWKAQQATDTHYNTAVGYWKTSNNVC